MNSRSAGSGNYFSTTNAAAYWDVTSAQTYIREELSTTVSGAKILARWDDNQAAAAIEVPYGRGKIIYVGCDYYSRVTTTEQRAFHLEAMNEAGVAIPVMGPFGVDYMTLGENTSYVFNDTGAAWNGSVQIDGQSMYVRTIVIDDQGVITEDSTTTSRQSGTYTVSRNLAAGSFLIVINVP